MKVGGPQAWCKGVRLTEDQMEQSKSEYICEAPTRDGAVVYIYGCGKGGLLLSIYGGL